MTEASTEEILGLAARIDDLPAYPGKVLGARLYQSDMAESTAEAETPVLLINEKWRSVIADALRFYHDLKVHQQPTVSD